MSAGPMRAPTGPFCQVIRFPGCAVTAQLNDSFLRRLNTELAASAQFDAGISGVLLGAFGSEESRLMVVEDFETTPAQGVASRRNGSLDDLLKTWEPHWGSRLCAVGIFATRRPAAPRLPVEQAAALASLFPHALGMILLAASETGRLELYLAEDGVVRTDSPHVSILAFPESVPGLAPLRAPEERPAALAAPTMEPQLRAAAPAPTRPRSRYPWIAAGALLAGGLGAAGGWYLRSGAPPASTSATAPTLSLTVERAAGGFELRWARDSEAVRRGQAGVLKVVDGAAVKMIALTPAQLATGRIIYVPRSEDVEFSLQVISEGNQLTTDGARVVRNLGFSAPVFESPAAISAWAQTSAPVSQPTERRSAPETSASQADGKLAADREEPRKTFHPPPGQPLSAPAPKVAEPAPLLTASARSALPASNPLPVDLPKVPPPANLPPSRETRVSSLIPPEPLVKKALSIHPDLRRRLPAGLQMKVRLSIDASGKVMAVKPVSEVSALLEPLYRLAAESASKWTFKPAILNGQPVSSECDITFQLK